MVGTTKDCTMAGKDTKSVQMVHEGRIRRRRVVRVMMMMMIFGGDPVSKLRQSPALSQANGTIEFKRLSLKGKRDGKILSQKIVNGYNSFPRNPSAK